MKTFIRLIDTTGRVVVPKPFREMTGIELDTPVAMECKGDCIIISPLNKKCVFCGEEADNVFKGTAICKKCAEELAAAVPVEIELEELPL